MTPEDDHAVLLIPGWRSRTGKLHIRRDCRAVQYHRQTMTPVLCRFDDASEAAKLLHDPEQLCRYCFPTGLGVD